MRSVSKKVAIIVILIVLIIGICGGVFAYLFLATDTFKDEQELFFNYLSQNFEKTKNIINLKTIENYKNIKNGATYEENSTISVKYSEGGEISNPYNNLSINLKNLLFCIIGVPLIPGIIPPVLFIRASSVISINILLLSFDLLYIFFIFI